MGKRRVIMRPAFFPALAGLRLAAAVALESAAVGPGLCAGESAAAVVPLPSVATAAAGRRIAALRAEIAHHDALYFQQAAPEISDAAYDQLKRELDGLEHAFPEAARRVPALAPVGDDRTGLFPTWRHRAPMLSLDKAYDESAVRAFAAGLAQGLGRADPACVVEPKLDGLAVSVIYERGRLVRAVTRGNGLEGDDITANARTIRSLPGALRSLAPDGTPNPVPELIELRGEIYVPWAEFARINREREAADEPLFAHPRNLAAGTARLRDPREVAERKLAVGFYGWGACEPASMAPVTQHGFHELARAWGLPGLAEFWTARGADEVWAAVRACARRKFAFPVDGAVVKLDAVPGRRELGDTERAPRWAIAYKFAPDRAGTRLRAITVQVGRTGLLTPVAELAPVWLGGSTVARATLHNRQVITRQDIRVGDFVLVEKAGGIIPAIVGVELADRPADSQPYVFPANCPACGATVLQLEGEAAVRCPNASCPAQVRQRIRHFASKGCADIGGLGPATIDALVRRARVANIADLYRLRPEDLSAGTDGWSRSGDRVLAAIERSKRAELWRIIHGLSIPHVGAATARDLARRFGSLDALAAARREDVAAEVGNAAANAVVAFFGVPQNRALVADLGTLGVAPAPPPQGDRRPTTAAGN